MAAAEARRLAKVYNFMLGVAKGDGGYYLAAPDVRKVVEIGCGYGDTLDVFRQKGFQTWGTEASPHRAAWCRRRGLRVFDFDLSRHLREMARLIRDGGYLYFKVPHFNQEFLLFQTHCAAHIHTFSPRSLALLLGPHGFLPIRLQVDEDIQVLARKTETAAPLFEYASSVRPEMLLEFLESPALKEGRSFQVKWDHVSVELIRADGGELLYRRRVHFNIAAEPVWQAVRFSVDAGAAASFPVRFSYAGDGHPPVWVK